MHKPRIAVVIPSFKAENTILQVLKQIPMVVDLVIVVNDASPDSTAQKVMSCTDERVTLITLKENQGVGAAMKTGYAYALSRNADIIVKIDSDKQMDPRQLTRLIEPLLAGEADYAKGNRFLHVHELRHMPLIRRIGNLGLSFLTKAASGYWNIFDPTNGFTAIIGATLRKLNPAFIANNYFFETSMLCELRAIDAVVQDVAIPAIYNGEKSSLKIPQQLLIFPISLALRTLKRISNRYFLYDFNAASLYIIVGLIMVLFGVIWGLIKWSASNQTGIPATTGTVLIAVLPLILGVQFLIQAAAIDIHDVPTLTPTISSRSVSENQNNLFEAQLHQLEQRSLITLEKESNV